MSATSRIKALLAGEQLARPAIAGWFHLPLVDRDPDAFIRETIRLTDEYQWDFVKVMSNGHYLAEAYGADIQFPDDPAQWSGVFRRYPIAGVEDLSMLPVLDKDNPVLAREIAIARSDLLSAEEFHTFSLPYDDALLNHVKDKTWFNILHIHGEHHLLFEPYLDYPVQAFNWENVPHDVPNEQSTGVAELRARTDKLLIAGIDQHQDFHVEGGNREAVKARLAQRLTQLREEGGDRGVIFAPGCALPLDSDRRLFGLLAEVSQAHAPR